MNRKRLIKEILEGKNAEENLPIYSSKLMSGYFGTAVLRLTMDYYTLYEEITEEKDNIKEIIPTLKQINDLIKKLVLSDSMENYDDNMNKVSHIRDEIIKKMKILTSYTDFLLIYEYILNRLELNYNDKLQEIDDTNFLQELITYIFADKDNTVITDKIKTVITQLPVRYTKSRYLDLVRDSLSLYKTGDKSSLNQFIYMMETSSMTYIPDGLDDYFEYLRNIKAKLVNINYKELTSESYNEYISMIDTAAEYIQNVSSFYITLQEMINYTYAIGLAMPYSIKIKDNINICFDIINYFNKQIENDKYVKIPSNIESKIVLTEGSQEEFLENSEILESALFDIVLKYQNMLESMMLDANFNCIITMQQLLSKSLFIEFTEIENAGAVTEEYFKKKSDELLAKFDNILTNSNRRVKRAIMACTLDKMPLFFKNGDEVVDYIKTAINTCNDKAEKTACITILKGIMTDRF